MLTFSRSSVLCLFLFGSFAFAQSNVQEDLGTLKASQLRSGLGWEINGNHEAEFAAAAAAGATHVRLDPCEWSQIEVQSAPPSNVSLGFAMTKGCTTALQNAKKYALQPTIVGAFGAPFHKILSVKLTAPAQVGDTSLSVAFASGVNGETLAGINPPYAYVLNSNGTQISKKYSYDGSLITNVSLNSSTSGTVSLSSALKSALPAGTLLTVNQALYASAVSGSQADAAVQAYARYAQFLAAQVASFGLTGDIELWNEPPWAQDCWDNRSDCFDANPNLPNALRSNSGNIGFAAALQSVPSVPGVTFTWSGTNKGSSQDLLGGGMLQYSGVDYVQQQLNVTTESFHPYGSNPEDSMWNEPCLQANLKAGQRCNTTGGSSNFVLTEVNNLRAKLNGPSYGIQHSITETGASTIYMPTDHMARFAMRQYLGYMADNLSYVEFYRLYDTSTPGQSGFGFMTSSDGGASLTPLQNYTALSGLMSDLTTIQQAPVQSYTATSLPAVTAYQGTYNLDHLSVVGTRAGDTANSVAYMLWQRSYSPSSCVPGDTTPCWGTLAQPPAAPVTLSVPSGLQVAQVINLASREGVSYQQSGSSIVLNVSDDPIEVMMIPASDSTSSLAVPTLSFPSIAPQMQAGSLTLAAFSNSPGSISYSVVSGSATLTGSRISFTGAGTIVVQANQAATSHYKAATATTEISVGGVKPTLTFAGIAPKTFGDSITVRATSASSGAVTYSVVSGPATVKGNVVTMTGSGTVTLGANQAAAGAYLASNATISFPVSQKKITLTFNSIPSVTFGNTVAVQAQSPSDGVITYTVVSGPATIAGNKVTPTSEGQVYLMASQAATNAYTGATTLSNFHVNAAVPSLTITPIADQAYNSSFTAQAVSPSNGTITYSIQSGPAHISGSTVTTLATAGTVVLKASQAVSGGYNAATATISFKVADLKAASTPTLVFASVAPKTFGAAPFVVSATSQSNAAVTYAVASGPATVSGNVVTLTGTGSVVLTAAQVANSQYTAAKATTTFSVGAETPSLTFAGIPAQAYGSPAFPVKASSASNGAVSYSVVSGPATISGNMVTLTGAGTVALAANQVAAGNYAAASASTSFAVTAQNLTFATISQKVAGNIFPITASSSSNGAITYSVVSGPAIVSGNMVTVTGAGTAVLQASQAATAMFPASTATTSYTSLNATSLTFGSIPVQVFGAAPFTVKATSTSDASIAYSVASGPATMVGNLVTVNAVGNVVLQASQPATGNRAAASATINFNVVSANPKLSFAAISSKLPGAVFAVSASSSSSSPVTYSVVSGPATIAGNTVSVTGNSGSVMLEADQAASGNYAAASTTISFPVVANNTSLTFASIPEVSYGDSFTVSATSASQGAITYSVVSGPARIAGNVVKTIGIGDVVLQAKQAADPTHAAQSTSISFPVAPLTPALAFVPITPKTFGDSLGIRATSNSNGAITYSVLSGPATLTDATITLNGSGTVVLGATQAAYAGYAPATTTLSFTVSPDPRPLTFAGITAKKSGQTFSVQAQSRSNGTITYSVASGPATVSGSSVTITGPGVVTLMATQAASGVYPVETATISFPVVH